MASPEPAGNYTEHGTCIRTGGAGNRARDAQSARTSRLCVAAMEGSRAQMFFLVEPGGYRGTAAAARCDWKEYRMNLQHRYANRLRTTLMRTVALVALASSLALAQTPPVTLPSVNVSASATATVTNDRLQA